MVSINTNLQKTPFPSPTGEDRTLYEYTSTEEFLERVNPTSPTSATKTKFSAYVSSPQKERRIRVERRYYGKH